MNANELYIHRIVIEKLAMGFDSPEDVKEIAQERATAEGFDISKTWINDRVDEEYRALAEQSASWTRPTDTEKLAIAFDELWKEHKFIALHKAGFTTSDGEGEVVEIEMALRESGTRSRGYCFYQEQDLERALDPSARELLLTYQIIDNDDPIATLNVGRVVAEKLKQHSFQLSWNDDVSKKIGIQNFNWRKIFREAEIDAYKHSRLLDMT